MCSGGQGERLHDLYALLCVWWPRRETPQPLGCTVCTGGQGKRLYDVCAVLCLSGGQGERLHNLSCAAAATPLTVCPDLGGRLCAAAATPLDCVSCVQEGDSVLLPLLRLCALVQVEDSVLLLPLLLTVCPGLGGRLCAAVTPLTECHGPGGGALDQGPDSTTSVRCLAVQAI